MEQIQLDKHVANCMSLNSLRRYRKFHNITCSANNRKTLSDAVASHFKNNLRTEEQTSNNSKSTIILNERDILSTFISAANVPSSVKAD